MSEAQLARAVWTIRPRTLEEKSRRGAFFSQTSRNPLETLDSRVEKEAFSAAERVLNGAERVLNGAEPCERVLNRSRRRF